MSLIRGCQQRRTSVLGPPIYSTSTCDCSDRFFSELQDDAPMKCINVAADYVRTSIAAKAPRSKRKAAYAAAIALQVVG